MIQNLQALVARTVSPLSSCLVCNSYRSGGSLECTAQSGFEGTFAVSIRPCSVSRKTLSGAENTAENFGAQIRVSWDHTPPVTYNSPNWPGCSAEHSQNLAAWSFLGWRRFCQHQEKLPGVFALSAPNGAEMLLTSIAAWSLTTKP